MKSRLLLGGLICLLLSVRASAFNFSVSTLQGVTLGAPTSIQFGPDHRLYVAQVNGQIKILTVQRLAPNSYKATATETINLIRDIPNYNDSGERNTTLVTRQVTGLLVVGPAASPIIYVTSSDPRIGGGSGGVNDTNLDTNSGVLSRLTKVNGAWTKLDLVRGLPRSEENHASNGMQLDEVSNTLYVAQGGNTNAGSPSVNFAYMCETALSAAILSVDLSVINALPVKTDAFGQKYLYDLPTLNDPNPSRAHNPDGSDVHDPFGGNDGLNQAKLVQGGPVQIYSPGYRNPYDLVITRTPGRSGRMYTFDNGANPGWGGYPQGEGTASVTNQYVSGETGTVNNQDNLHLVTKDYYAGHPTPLRANPAGAGWFHFDESLPSGSQMVFSSNPTSDWPAVPVALANPVESDYRQPGVSDGALLTNPASTNGLTEYVATNFSGGMQGNLIAASYNGNVLRIALSADGNTVTNGLEVLASGFGSLPLDVTAPDPAHGAPFVGTIWVSHYSPAKISVLEPADFDNPGGSTCTGINSFDIDEDGDGYSNADELANGSDPCSGAIRPPDWDGDHLSDLLDPDDDDDGIPDVQDPLPLDPTDGRAVPASVHYELFNETGIGFYGVGMTGLMLNRGHDYLPLITPDNAVAGGTAGLFTLSQVGTGTPRGSANTQKDAYQFGYNSTEFSPHFVVASRLAGPFFNSTPTDSQLQGIYLGSGDQDNYVSVALHANGGAGGLQVVYEVGGTISSEQMYPLAGVNALSTIDLSFEVDPIGGTVQPRYQLPEGPVVPLGARLTVGGDVLMALMGRYPLAIGMFANRGSSGTPNFTATWDWFEVAPAATGAVAKITIDPVSANMATASTYANGSFAIQNLSTGGQQIETVSLDLRTAILPDLVFDITGTAGDPVFKVFTPNSATGGVTLDTGVMTHPHNGTTAEDGYDGIDVSFTAFPANGVFSFSIDADPNNVKGVAQPGEHDSASVSGLDLIGTTATVYFSDGAVQRTRVGRLENSVSGSYGWARTDMPPRPGLAVLGLTPPVTTGTAAQTVRVSGPAGLNVALVRSEAGLYLGGVPGGGYNVQPYDANTVVALNETAAVVGATGYVDIPVTLTRADPKAGYNFFTATLATAGGVKGPASAALEVRYDPALGGDTQPPDQPGTLSFTNVTANSITINWTASTDNVGVTGYRISRGATVLSTVDALTYTDGGLSPNTAYTYSVVALDAAGNASPATTGTVSTVSAVLPTTVRINTGGPNFVDSTGQTWNADTGFNTGTTTSYTTTVTGTTEPTLFKTERYDGPTAPELQYTLGLQNGSYTVRLYFAETYTGAQSTGARVFDVYTQGQLAFANVDIFTQAGGANKALVLSAPATVTNNQITIQFIHKVQNPKINAIEIIPAGSGSDTTAPTAPGSLAATAITANSLTLTWAASTDNVGVTGYNVSRNGVLLGTVTATNYPDSGLSPATTYNYSVVAVDAAGNASTASTVSATTAAGTDTQPPSAPGALAFSNVTANSVTLSWVAATDNVGVTAYRVTRGATVVATINALTYTDSGLTPATAYTYSVVALDAAANVSPASTGTTTTAAAPGGPAVRVNAGGPSYVDGNGNTWSADTGYNTGGSSTSTATVTGTSDPTLFKTERYDQPATPELLYTFTVPNGSYTVNLYFAETYAATQGAGKRVFDINIQAQSAFTGVDIYTLAGGGNKALVLSRPATVSNGKLTVQFIHKVQNPKVNAIELIPAVASDTQAPTAPTGLASSSITTTSLTLNWTAATDNVGVTGYRISRDGALLTTVTPTTFQDSGLTPGTAYAYSVVAVDAAGNVSAPATLDVTTAPPPDTTPPSAPTGLASSNLTTTSVRLGWTAATDNVGVAGYEVSRDGAVVGTVTTTSFDDTGLTPGTTYQYSVVALDAAGNASSAATLPVTTASTAYALRINAGGPAYVDGSSNTWVADTGFNTGKMSTESGTVVGTPNPQLFKTVRWDDSTAPEMMYTLGVPNGSYRVRLHFAETNGTLAAAGKRVFDINVQSQLAFQNVDIFTQAGGAWRALVLETTATVSNGQLQIQFIHRVNNPRISAIEILSP